MAATLRSFVDLRNEKRLRHQATLRARKAVFFGSFHWDHGRARPTVVLYRTKKNRSLNGGLFTVRDLCAELGKPTVPTIWCDHRTHATGDGHDDCLLSYLHDWGAGGYHFQWVVTADGCQWRAGTQLMDVQMWRIDVSDELIVLMDCVSALLPL